LDAVNAGNAQFVEQLYEAYKTNPNSVDPQWAAFFSGFEFAGPVGQVIAQPTGEGSEKPDLQVSDLIHSYRELGHLVANLDPLGHNIGHHPLLELSEFGLTAADMDRMVNCSNFKGIPAGRCTLKELMAALRTTYCGTFAVEYMDIRDPEQRQWLQDQMEPTLNKAGLTTEERRQLMNRLIATEDFELYLQNNFGSVKRFSNEGGDALIPLLDEVIDRGADMGVNELLFGMPHRGRLNVLTHILKKPYEMILSEVAGRPVHKTAGDGDVKYHLGYATEYTTPRGKKVHLSLAANPSHLELVDPIVEGMCRAKQNRKGDFDRDQTVPVLMHGDAAFTGQGIVAETLYLSELEAYRTGGTVHVIVNNQVGFTTNPSDGRFTRYPSDVAKAIQAPVFHVNGDDPEACLQAARLAIAFRQQFKADVIIDLVCYRRRGHNEQDDASITQPVMAREIVAHPTVRQLYGRRLLAAGVVTQVDLDGMAGALNAQLEKAKAYAEAVKPSDAPPPVHGPWAAYSKAPKDAKDWQLRTAVDKETLKNMARQLLAIPEGFNINPIVKRMVDQRAKSIETEKDINWGCGEMLALGSLLNEGTWIRLTGQDVSRGTFSHRNAVWFDHQSGRPHVPLATFAEGKSRFMIINTMLSEFAVVGFEYGFASADPQTLVIWEAQFGDFVNMCQPIIDQYIVSSESKWGKYCGLVMFLPHGYEGQGPEHSHARLERFLQLCAEDNIQVTNPTTPAQLFHLLRRQINRPFRKPLIVMSPKSLLRNPLAVSTLDEFATGGYQDLMDETDAGIDKSKVRRVLMCSGKVYYELLAERTKQKITDIAILRLEQIYPFPSAQLTEMSKQYPTGVEVYWVQEEPRNNGVYPFIGAKLHYHWVGIKKLYYVGRKPSASPAAGSKEQHDREQQDIINKALGVTERPGSRDHLKPANDVRIDGRATTVELSASKEPSRQ
jgi:2-oxoglutarate dehydrogenase E1 component